MTTIVHHISHQPCKGEPVVASPAATVRLAARALELTVTSHNHKNSLNPHHYHLPENLFLQERTLGIQDPRWGKQLLKPPLWGGMLEGVALGLGDGKRRPRTSSVPCPCMVRSPAEVAVGVSLVVAWPTGACQTTGKHNKTSDPSGDERKDRAGLLQHLQVLPHIPDQATPST